MDIIYFYSFKLTASNDQGNDIQIYVTWQCHVVLESLFIVLLLILVIWSQY